MYYDLDPCTDKDDYEVDIRARAKGTDVCHMTGVHHAAEAGCEDTLQAVLPSDREDKANQACKMDRLRRTPVMCLLAPTTSGKSGRGSACEFDTKRAKLKLLLDAMGSLEDQTDHLVAGTISEGPRREYKFRNRRCTNGRNEHFRLPPIIHAARGGWLEFWLVLEKLDLVTKDATRDAMGANLTDMENSRQDLTERSEVVRKGIEEYAERFWIESENTSKQDVCKAVLHHLVAHAAWGGHRVLLECMLKVSETRHALWE